MKILHTNFHHYMVGETRRILNVCLCLRDRGHTVILATPQKSKLSELAQSKGLTVLDSVKFRRGFRPISFIKDIYYLHRAIRRYQIEIIHTHGSQDSWAGALAAWLTFRKVLVFRTRHNHFPVSRHLLNRWLYQRLTDRLVVISEYIRMGFTKDNFMPDEKMSIIYSGINIEEFKQSNDGQRFRNELGISSEEQLVGLVAFITPRKGHKYFVEAAEKIIKSQDIKVKFVIVGDGDDLLVSKLKEKVKDTGLEKQILFTGFRGDVPTILSGLDIFVLPTLDEALGMAIVEALASKKPVVATDVGGVPEMVHHMETGLLVPPRDANKLSEAISTLLHDKELAQRLAENGSKLMDKNFSLKAMTDKTEEVYQRLLSNSG